MVVFQDPPLVVDGIDQPARLVDAAVAPGPDDLAELAETSAVVLTGPLATAVALAQQVPELGPSVVVEIEVHRGDRLDLAPFDDLAALGLAAGVHVVGDLDPSDHDAVGWELGAVTWLLTLGVRTVRGVDERRLRRLVAVAGALDAATDPVVSDGEVGP